MVRTVSRKLRGNGTPEVETDLNDHGIQKTIIGTYLIREDILVVQNVLSPIHQSVYVFWGWKFGGLLVLDTIFPQVLVP